MLKRKGLVVGLAWLHACFYYNYQWWTVFQTIADVNCVQCMARSEGEVPIVHLIPPDSNQSTKKC